MRNFFSKNDLIKETLDKLSRGVSLPWPYVARCLDEIEKTKYWADTASSFTEWLKNNEEKLGSKESTLWRYLVVGRYYQDLQKQFLRVNLDYPPLSELPAHVSPEKLEVLSKLARVAPRDFFEELMYQVLDNTITRDDIREKWKAFRPALKGKTARGRRVLAPSVNIKNQDEYKSIQEAMIINAIKAAGSSWLSDQKPQMYEVQMHVTLNKDDPVQQPLFPAVVLYKESKTKELEVHGLETMQHFAFNKHILKRLERLSEYCDYLWVVKYKDDPSVTPNGFVTEHYPAYAGLIMIDGSDISIVRQALACQQDYKKSNELLKALLLKEVR